MKVLAISVGRPREVEWGGGVTLTSIFKDPVEGRVRVGRLNIEGDEQSDLSVHGRPEKAVYAYPSEHYALWRAELPDADFSWGAFGENFSTEGLTEGEVRIGDRFRIGTAEFVVTQPRSPCFKLGIRFGRADMVKRFHQSGRSGFYLAVETEGEIRAGDAIETISRDDRDLTVADVVGLYAAKKPDPELLERAIAHPGLIASWREYFQDELDASRS